MSLWYNVPGRLYPETLENTNQGYDQKALFPSPPLLTPFQYLLRLMLIPSMNTANVVTMLFPYRSGHLKRSCTNILWILFYLATQTTWSIPIIPGESKSPLIPVGTRKC
jgi:hypothetical protein